jgi:hypothetical protein
MSSVAVATTASRSKSNRTRHYASTMVHYLGVEQALEACRKKGWPGVRDEILRQQSVLAGSGGTDSHSP